MQDDARGLDKGDARDARLSGPKKLRFREQDHVRKQMSKDAIEKCHVTRDAYIECARGTLSCQICECPSSDNHDHPPFSRSDLFAALYVSRRVQGVQRVPEGIVCGIAPHLALILTARADYTDAHAAL